MDKHLGTIAKEHPECLMLSLDAYKVRQYMLGPVFRPEAGRADSADAVLFHEGRARGETDLLRRFLVRRVQNHRAGPEVTIV